jgi:precorrin isomerase
LNSRTYENAETIEDESIEEIMEEIEQKTDEIPLEIINKESINSEDLDKSKTIVLEEDEIEPLSNTINTDDIPFDINTSHNETDIPLTIKSKPEENSNSDLNKGAQLGLF